MAETTGDSHKKPKLSDDFMDDSMGISMEEFEKDYEENYGLKTVVPCRSMSAAAVLNISSSATAVPKLDRIDSSISERSVTASPISQLNNLLQSQSGWQVVYQDLSPSFTICATVTGPGVCKIFESGKAHRNKKEARVAAATVALAWCHVNVPLIAQESPSTDWVSQLHQFVQKRDKWVSFRMDTYAVGPFSFKCNITLKDGHVCGADLTSQPSKARARQEACKVALDYLLTSHKERLPELPLPKTSGVSFRPDASIQEGSSVSIVLPDLPDETEVEKSPMTEASGSTAQKVHDLCKKLQIQPPSYHLTPDVDIESLWSGYAMLSGPTVPQQWRDAHIAEIDTVFGNKDAREQLAFQSLQVLRQISDEVMAARVSQ